jgi:hypothetical protein
MFSPATPTSEPIVCCGDCGAERRDDRVTCWHCGASFIATERNESLIEVPRHSFSLSSLMLLFIVASVVLAIGTVTPCFGVFLGMISLIAWMRTSGALRERAIHGRASSTSDKTYLFLRALLTSFAMVVLLGLIIFLGFWVGAIAYSVCGLLCVSLRIPEWFFHPIALVIAIVTSLWVTVPALRWLDKAMRTTFRVEDRMTFR